MRPANTRRPSWSIASVGLPVRHGDAIVISERIEKSGADLVSLSERIDTTTAAGKMVFRMLAVLSEFEADLVAERTKGALGHLRNQGKRISGRIPFGFDLSPDGETLSLNTREQQGPSIDQLPPSKRARTSENRRTNECRRHPLKDWSPMVPAGYQRDSEAGQFLPDHELSASVPFTRPP
jgi:DNA invertase Pin-like site-specific DNA recombinase